MNLGETFFKDTRPGEHVVAIIRRHWFILFKDIFGLAVIFLIPFFLVPLVFGTLTQGGAINASGGFVLFFASLWSLIIWNLIFFRWTDYYYDVWILTSDRIIDIDQRGLFHRDVATLFDLNHIEDVKTILSGVIGNIFNFGKIQIQTAATRDEFVIDGIANPVHFERLIRDTQQKHMAEMFDRGHPPMRRGRPV